MTKLNDVCLLVVDCEHKTAPVQKEGYPSIRTPNIGRGRLILDGVNRVSEETYHLWTRRAIPQAGDLILAREAPIGNVAIITTNLKVCLGQRTVLIRPNPEMILPEYFVYLLLGDEIQGRVRSLSNGATVHHLNMEEIRNLKLPELPSFAEQHVIGKTLSAYDDLIENNTRRIQILEEMAQAIYREWFVHFRFPGHEGVRMVESEMGEIPEGWELKSFSSLIIIDPPTTVKKDEEKPFIDMGGLSSGLMIVRWSEKRKGTSGSKFLNRDTLFPRITPCVENGKNGFVQCLPDGMAGIGSTEFIVFREKVLPAEMIYFISRDEKFRENAVKSMVGASGRQRVRKECFDIYIIPVPPVSLLEKYQRIVEPMFKAIQNLANKNVNLRQQRDLLLPLLINGDIDITSWPNNALA